MAGSACRRVLTVVVRAHVEVRVCLHERVGADVGAFGARVQYERKSENAVRARMPSGVMRTSAAMVMSNECRASGGGRGCRRGRGREHTRGRPVGRASVPCGCAYKCMVQWNCIVRGLDRDSAAWSAGWFAGRWTAWRWKNRRARPLRLTHGSARRLGGMAMARQSS